MAAPAGAEISSTAPPPAKTPPDPPAREPAAGAADTGAARLCPEVPWLNGADAELPPAGPEIVVPDAGATMPPAWETEGFTARVVVFATSRGVPVDDGAIMERGAD